jgi:hypothetical protein
VFEVFLDGEEETVMNPMIRRVIIFCVGLAMGSAIYYLGRSLWSQREGPVKEQERVGVLRTASIYPLTVYLSISTDCSNALTNLIVINKLTMRIECGVATDPLHVADNDTIAITRGGEEWFFDAKTRTLERTLVPLKEQ